ncbi:cation:proton antiporter [Hoeflea sp. AS60]|uniref:cation:proton antiporter n=1 Tax=Hoeflea sp. AS60 TaxID=3135780 RepID=UPI00316D52D2
MQNEPFFGLNSYHVALAVVGVIVIAARWLPRLVSKREPASAPLMILFGAGAALLIPGLPPLPDPRDTPLPWELVSELTVIVALFGAGMRIDRLRPWKRWIGTSRMLGIAMPLTILAVALLGVGLVGLTVAGAILLGAVLAPTDPVLASDVQVGPPHEGAEHPVRFTLTTEAGLNDGLAFPFVYLGLIVAAEGLSPGSWALDWFLRDIVYRIALGIGMGWLGGRVLGYILFSVPRGSVLAETGSGVIALAGVLLCYGSTELIEGYGFIAVAVLGLTLRRVEEDHAFHRQLHDFTESIEHALTALLLIALGSVMPILFADLTWTHFAVALLLILVIRPLSGWVALLGTDLKRRDRAVVSVYGVRGIGSIYYLCYAGSHMEFTNEAPLWSLIALVILMSTILHGFTVGWAMDSLKEEAVKGK